MTLDPSTLELLGRIAATHWPNTVGKLADAIRAWQAAGCPNLSTNNQPQQEADTMAHTTTTTTTDAQASQPRDRNHPTRQNWRKRDDILNRLDTMPADSLRVLAARQALALVEIERRLWDEQGAMLRTAKEDRATRAAKTFDEVVSLRRLIPDPLDLGLATFAELMEDHHRSIYAPGADFDPDTSDARFDLLFSFDNNSTRRTVRSGSVECVISTTVDGWRLECHDRSDPDGYTLQDQMDLAYDTTSTGRAQVEWVKFVERHAPAVPESALSLPPSVVTGRDWMALRMDADLMPWNWRRRVDRTCGGTGKPTDRHRILVDWLTKHPVHELARVLAALNAERAANVDELDGIGRFKTDTQSRLWIAISDELDSRLRPFTLRFYTFDEWDADDGDNDERFSTYHKANTAAAEWLADPNAIGRQVIRKLVITGPTPAGCMEWMNPRYRADLVDQGEDDGGAASEAKWIAGSAFGNQGLADLGGLDVEGGDE